MPIRLENVARYPADWKLRSRFVRQYRARNRCEWCGIANYAVTMAGSPVDGHAGYGLDSDGERWSYADARQYAADLYASRFGVEGAEPNRYVVVVLTVAHVFDDRPEACSLLNLAALCQRCHNGHDWAARRARIRDRRRAHTPDLFLTAAELDPDSGARRR